MVGRFIGALVMQKIKAGKVLAFNAVCACLLVATAMFSAGTTAMWALLLVGLCNSIMFPTIFSISIEDLGELKPQGSGILCTAIAGGAFIPPLYGYFTDISSFKTAFLLLIICYAYIWYFARKSSRLKPIIL